MNAPESALQYLASRLLILRDGVSVFARDVGYGLLEVSHNTLALLGLTVVAGLIFMGGTEDMRNRVESFALGWLQDRLEQRAEQDGNLLSALAEPQASKRATALEPDRLTQEQAAVAAWLSKRYRVALEPVSRLVHESWTLGSRGKLEPTLILAVVAVESSFNPFAQSPMGAQGLMQVMRRIHDDKYQAFGGAHAAFDPVSNLRVGVQVLRDCVARNGGLEEGLRCYVGVTHPDGDDNGYTQKVMAEQRALQQVAQGKAVPHNMVHQALPAVAATAWAQVAVLRPEP
ncbi:MAG: lytic transglycosylase domain-containing protein [Betaproteobacteria bacterium]|nr:lytic transglycosylase domain-containing protein [Betaproteobacteria bacterium]NBT10607.1 lytic transglycosylase domain-containing protein [Betaproteobacteria bacterium]NBU48588.1 lytic transglycosylase domain-containing protein [Betaproteobacteria bacterium]